MLVGVHWPVPVDFLNRGGGGHQASGEGKIPEHVVLNCRRMIPTESPDDKMRDSASILCLYPDNYLHPALHLFPCTQSLSSENQGKKSVFPLHSDSTKNIGRKKDINASGTVRSVSVRQQHMLTKFFPVQRVLDFDTYYMDLEEANEAGPAFRPQWRLVFALFLISIKFSKVTYLLKNNVRNTTP